MKDGDKLLMRLGIQKDYKPYKYATDGVTAYYLSDTRIYNLSKIYHQELNRFGTSNN